MDDGRAAKPGAAGWCPDPYGRHDQRHWNGAAWTSLVANARQLAVDEEPVAGASAGASAEAPVADPSGHSDRVRSVASAQRLLLLRTGALVLALVTLLLPIAAGCADSNTPKERESALKTFASNKLFAFAYDSSRFLLRSPDTALVTRQETVHNAGISRKGSVGAAVYDRKGGLQAGRPTASVVVTATKLPFSVVTGGQAVLKDVVDQTKLFFAFNMPSARVGKPYPAVVSGEPAWAFTFSGQIEFGQDPGMDFGGKAIFYWFVRGSYVYRIQESASADSWSTEKPLLDRVVQSFHPTSDAESLAGQATYSNRPLRVSLSYPRRFVKTLDRAQPGKRKLLEVQFMDSEQATSTRFALLVLASPRRVSNQDSADLRDYYEQLKGELEREAAIVGSPSLGLQRLNGKVAWHMNYLREDRQYGLLYYDTYDVYVGDRVYIFSSTWSKASAQAGAASLLRRIARSLSVQ